MYMTLSCDQDHHCYLLYMKKKKKLLSGGAGEGRDGGLIDIYLSCRLEEHQQVKVLNAAGFVLDAYYR